MLKLQMYAARLIQYILDSRYMIRVSIPGNVLKREVLNGIGLIACLLLAAGNLTYEGKGDLAPASIHVYTRQPADDHIKSGLLFDLAHHSLQWCFALFYSTAG